MCSITVFVFLFSLALIKTAKDPHPMSLTVVQVGGNFTLQCPVSEKGGKFFQLYKQSLGYMVQTVASGNYGQQKLVGQFENSRFQVTKGSAEYIFTIRNVSKEDEATYFCQNGTSYSTTISNGIFLAVKGILFYFLVYAHFISHTSNLGH